MSEKKTKSATEANEAAPKKAKKTSAKKSKKESNPADVRKKVSKIVQAKAVKMAEAVIGKTKAKVPPDLQLATVKYMFEVAAIYPPQADQDAATADEDCLARTLLNRLNIPDEPIRRDEEEDEEVEASSEKAPAEPAQEKSESKDSDAAEGGEPESI